MDSSFVYSQPVLTDCPIYAGLIGQQEGQLLVLYRTLLSCSCRIVFAQMCILLYYWANKMMMMIQPKRRVKHSLKGILLENKEKKSKQNQLIEVYLENDC